MDLVKQLQDFIAKHTGVKNVGDTDQNRGECVGLSEVWLDTVAYPHIWGNAIDLLNNADPAFYTVTINTPFNFPKAGDIIVFGQPYGPYQDSKTNTTFYDGHTGIVVDADVNSVTVFEQNNPVGSAPRIVKHTYGSVKGWISLKEGANKAVPASVATSDDKPGYYKGIDTTNIDSVKVAIDAWYDLSQGNIYMKKTECAAQNKDLEELQKKLEGFDDIKNNYATFTAVGYTTYDDVKKDLDKKDATILKLQQDQAAIERKNKNLADTISTDSQNAYTAMEEGIKTVDTKKELENNLLDVSKELGVKPDINAVMDRIFYWKDLGQRYLKQLDNAEAKLQRVRTAAKITVTATNLFSKLFGAKKKGVS
jgi:hypothetical protein